ncbi:hypothetical protein BOTBODRAFT_179096 [Botryobasidium botryosum FD-172 SS1]|uniref:Uncharacterized protein n=1 Tax=Botryobasidium botryosum (strain FD-172 SS1) TaxID=930990 RepID=A0A067M0Y0_BOTB1|nr:hypothetical protein BOTBODRAFT_179096 [Botryobasidium botryosum FD-172 SS1]
MDIIAQRHRRLGPIDNLSYNDLQHLSEGDLFERLYPVHHASQENLPELAALARVNHEDALPTDPDNAAAWLAFCRSIRHLNYDIDVCTRLRDDTGDTRAQQNHSTHHPNHFPDDNRGVNEPRHTTTHEDIAGGARMGQTTGNGSHTNQAEGDTSPSTVTKDKLRREIPAVKREIPTTAETNTGAVGEITSHTVNRNEDDLSDGTTHHIRRAKAGQNT